MRGSPVLLRPGTAGRAALLLILSCLAAGSAFSHEIRPALLDIVESEPGVYDVTWKVPARGGAALGVRPVFPASWESIGPARERRVPGAAIQRMLFRSAPGSLLGETLVIEGLEGVRIDVLVRIEGADGVAHSAILRPESPAFVVPETPGGAELAAAYWQMGVVHILEGVDHLLFLLALLLLVDGFRRLVATVTAFTLAHSVTLGLATLGFVNLPSAPTEAVIALSILFLAVEIVRKNEGKEVLTARRPWLVALAFGLFHGLGFAGALSEVGVPANDVPLALLMFNLGVETGQLAFVVVALGALSFLRRLPIPRPAGSWRLAPYTIGALAAFWTIQRVTTSVTGTGGA